MMVHFLPTHRYSGLHIILPDGKILSINNRLYNNSGYFPDYNSIQYQRPTLIAKSTMIPQHEVPFNVTLPQPLITYPRFIVLIGLKLEDGASSADVMSLYISNLSIYLSEVNDEAYSSIRYWWVICWQSINNVYCATTQKSTSTGVTIKMPQDNFLTISHRIDSYQIETFEVNFIIF